MRTTTANFDTEKNKVAGSQIRTLLEIDASPTLYYSDQPLTVSGQDYDPVVMNFGPIKNQVVPDENVVRTAGWKFRLSNIPKIDSLIKPGQNVRAYIWYEGLATADKLPFFTGIVKGFGKGGFYELPVICEDMGQWFNKTVGQLMSLSAYPDADPDDIGKIIPPGYGTIRNHRGLASQAGAATTLADDIAAGFTGPIEVTDVSRFPDATTTVIIGLEEIRYTETLIDGNDRHWIQGTITRGHNGTDDTSHSKSDAVLEKTAIKFKFFDTTPGPVRDMSRARVVPWGHPEKEAVLVDDLVGSYDLTNGEVNFPDPIAVAKRVEIAVTEQPDQPITTQPLFSGSADHAHNITGTSQVTIYGVGVDSQQNVTNPGNAFDQNFDTTSAILTYTSPSSAHLGLDFDFSGFDGLVIKQAVACIRASVDVSSNVAKLRLPGLTFGLLNQDLNIGGGVATQKFIVSGLLNETDWSKLDTLRILVAGPGGPLITQVFQIWWEITFEPSLSSVTLDSTVSNRITDVAIGGDSVADFLGGYVIIDAEGYKDDGSGTYTGTPDALIERPGHVIHHLIANFSNGAAASDIDLAGSFADVESNLPASYKFTFALTDPYPIPLNNLLAQLAWQCWCRFLWGPDGKARLNRIRSTGTPDKTLDTDDDSLLIKDRLAVGFSQLGLDSEGISNYIKLYYNLDATLGGQDNPDAYAGLSEQSDSASITDYKTREKELLAFAIGDNQTMADSVATNFLDRYKFARRTVTFPTWLKNVELEAGDIPQVTCTQLNMFGRLYEMLGVDYNPPVPISGKGPELWLRMLDMLYVRLAYSDSAVVTDSAKIDIEAKAADSAVITDPAKIDIEAKAADSAVITDPAKIDIEAKAADSAVISDTATIKSLWFFDSTRYFDSTKKFNSPP